LPTSTGSTPSKFNTAWLGDFKELIPLRRCGPIASICHDAADAPDPFFADDKAILILQVVSLIKTLS
jgi:hypothetical protein